MPAACVSRGAWIAAPRGMRECMRVGRRGSEVREEWVASQRLPNRWVTVTALGHLGRTTVLPSRELCDWYVRPSRTA